MRPEDLAKGVIRLVPLPEVFIRVSKMIEDGRCSADRIAVLIGQDPSLTARLLKIANSPFYGFPSRIDTLARAVTVIGTRGLRELILAVATTDIFGRLGGNFFDMGSFWRHSLYCGINARLLALRCDALQAESLFTAGVLHNIGQLIVLNKLPEMGREAQLRARDSGVPLFRVEREIMGFDHAEVGGALLQRWRLPATICEAVACHHAPELATEAPVATALVHIANAVAGAEFPLQVRDNGKAPPVEACLQIQAGVWDVTGLCHSEVDAVRDEALAQFQALAEVMLPQAA